jgi:hypothetical protein
VRVSVSGANDVVASLQYPPMFGGSKSRQVVMAPAGGPRNPARWGHEPPITGRRGVVDVQPGLRHSREGDASLFRG